MKEELCVKITDNKVIINTENTNNVKILTSPELFQGWSWSNDDAGYLSLSGRSISFDNRTVRAYCACSRC